MSPCPKLWKKVLLFTTGSSFCRIHITSLQILTDPRRKQIDWRRPGTPRAGETIRVAAGMKYRNISLTAFGRGWWCLEIKMGNTAELRLEKHERFHLGKVIWDPGLVWEGGTERRGKWSPHGHWRWNVKGKRVESAMLYRGFQRKFFLPGAVVGLLVKEHEPCETQAWPGATGCKLLGVQSSQRRTENVVG